MLILTEPLNSVDEPSQRYIYDAMETQVGSDRLPVGYPGLLQDLEQVYVVSTTAETTRRMNATATRKPLSLKPLRIRR